MDWLKWIPMANDFQIKHGYWTCTTQLFHMIIIYVYWSVKFISSWQRHETKITYVLKWKMKMNCINIENWYWSFSYDNVDRTCNVFSNFEYDFV